MIFPGGGVVYYSSCCHSRQCFHVTALCSPDVTPLIHVPDLQSQALGPEGNGLMLLQNPPRRPALLGSLRPRVFNHCIRDGGEQSLSLDQQDGILRNFSQSHNLPSSPIHSFGPSQQNRPPSHKSHRMKKPETADQFFDSLPPVRLTWAPGHTESGQSFNPHRRPLLCEYHQASQPRWTMALSFIVQKE